jgi:SAM-dependent methyltransferase
MAGYLFDQAWTQEKRRLDALARVYDPETFSHLQRLGVAAGTRCLEVGAGSGTVAQWMYERVSPGGAVVATDLDPRFLEQIATDGLEVRRHDIAADPIERAAFDVVHARTVLQHVPERDRALRAMVSALRPGGRLLIEDIISAQGAAFPALPAWPRVLRALEHGLRSRGADPDYGLQLPHALAAVGLQDVDAAAHVALLRSGTPDVEFVILTIEQVGPRLIEHGVVEAAEVAALLDALRAPGTLLAAATMISAWGTAAAHAA